MPEQITVNKAQVIAKLVDDGFEVADNGDGTFTMRHSTRPRFERIFAADMQSLQEALEDLDWGR